MNWFNKLVAQTLPVVPKPIVRKVSSRYIAGETLDQALSTVRELNQAGMCATLDVLGEFVATGDEARRAGDEYIEVLGALAREGLDSNVSIKLTQMGLKVDHDLCLGVTRGIVDEATRLGSFVRIDMEDSSCTDSTLQIYRELVKSYPENVGCVIQAYMKRTRKDAEDLGADRANVRICKGIYIEDAAIAFKDPEEINRSFVEALKRLLKAGSYIGIATHDKTLVTSAYDLIRDLGIDRDGYEFQMLLGVQEQLRQQILDRGHKLRVYVPYGSHWYAYSLRRLKENPEIAGHVMRGILNGGKSL